MEPHRSSYPDESEPRWYRGEQQYQDPGAHPHFEPHVDEGGYRVPDRRAGGRMPPAPPPGMAGPAGPWPGDALPPPPADMHQRDPMQATTTREVPRTGRSARSTSSPSGAGRRLTAATLIAIVVALLALPILRILLDSAFGPPLSASGVLSSALALLGLPLGAIGLYALTSRAAAPDEPAHHAWLRPPVAYLTVGLILFLAAGLAAAG